MKAGALTTVGVVVIHYHRWPDLSTTIQDALDAGIEPASIVVVDNGSPDGAADEFASAFPHCEWRTGHGNLGYAAAVNIGMRRLAELGLDTAVVLTHEVRFEPSLIGELYSLIQSSPRIRATAPRLRRLSDPALTWSEGGDLNEVTFVPTNRTAYTAAPPAWVDGCCFMVRIEDFLRLGGMYEPYFLYMEEVDFFVRLRRSGGDVVLLPRSFAYQEPGTMSMYHATRNRIILAYRLGGWLSRCFVVLETLARLIHGVARHPLSSRGKQKERLSALRHGIAAGRAGRAELRATVSP